MSICKNYFCYFTIGSRNLPYRYLLLLLGLSVFLYPISSAQILPTATGSRCAYDYNCPTNLGCLNGFCSPGIGPTIPPVTVLQAASEHLQDRPCIFDYQCPSTYSCVSFTCWSMPQGRTHFEGIKCAYDGQCPTGYVCSKMTCWKGGETRNHLQARLCLFDFDCPASYSCSNYFCYDGAPIQHIEARMCQYDFECPSGYTCQPQKFTCYADANNVHSETMCLQNTQCVAGQVCTSYTCRTGEVPLAPLPLLAAPG